MAARKKSGKKKAAASLVGLTATESRSSSPPAEVAGLARAVEEDGGAVLATYREPFGGRWLLLVSLPSIISAMNFLRGCIAAIMRESSR